MRIKINKLRRIVRNVLQEMYEREEEGYEDTVLPDELADSDLLAEPDLTDQSDRDEYIKRRNMSKKKKGKLRSAEETEEGIGDEHAIAGHIGPLGASGYGPGNKPYGKQKKLRSRNAMGNNRPLDEYDE